MTAPFTPVEDPATPGRPPASIWATLVACAGLLAMLGGWGVHLLPSQPKLLLAPMIGGLEPCYFPDRAPAAERTSTYAQACLSAGRSAAPVIESTLRQLGPASSRDGRFELGYTLPIPLLRFLRPSGAGWEVDRPALHRAVQTIRDEPRAAVVHLFSTHFSSGSAAETTLAQDPGNLLTTQSGPIQSGKYYGIDIIPWSFVRTDNAITQARQQVVAAVLEELCALPPAALGRVRAVTLLGELHHLYPNFESGMGFAPPYLITDYSAASTIGFRRFVAARFGSVDRLNAALGSAFTDFEQLAPPAKDMRTDPAAHVWEHIDSYAQGTLQVSGWAFVPGSSSKDPARVAIYRNGRLAALVAANLSRQDVIAAFPEFKTADVGWVAELDFAQWPQGEHRIDVLLERAGQPAALMGSRTITVSNQAKAPSVPSLPLGPVPAVAGDVRYSLDLPADHTRYIRNPLVPLWHAFRQQQISTYLSYFQQIVAKSCIPAERIYSHQILPDVNPGWDANKFATGRDLAVPPALGLGVSLYGEASYGRSFADRYARMGRSRYGVTEFHPLRAMGSSELAQTWQRHRAAGAEFLSFFMDAKGLKAEKPEAANPFAFNPDNPKFGSDALFNAAREGLAAPAQANLRP